MSDYVVLAWREAAADQALVLKQSLSADRGWRLTIDSRGLAVFVCAERPLPLLRLPGVTGVIIGSIFDTEAATQGRGSPPDLTHLPRRDLRSLCSHLISATWGSYVAILPDADGAPNVLRDPLGGLECLTWRRDEVFVVASRLDLAAPHAPRALTIDWTGIARLLRQKNLSSAIVPLTGVEGVDPGLLRTAEDGSARLWRPSDFARRRMARPDATPDDLARVVDGCVAAWSLGRSGILCEISGGLDSAIVVAALRRARAPVVLGLNHYWSEPEADERAYARDVASAAQVMLTERAHGLLALDPVLCVDTTASTPSTLR